MDTKDLYAPYASEHTRVFNERISKDPVYPFAGVRIPVLRRLAKEAAPDEITIRYHEDVILKGLAVPLQAHAANGHILLPGRRHRRTPG